MVPIKAVSGIVTYTGTEEPTSRQTGASCRRPRSRRGQCPPQSNWGLRLLVVNRARGRTKRHSYVRAANMLMDVVGCRLEVGGSGCRGGRG